MNMDEMKNFAPCADMVPCYYGNFVPPLLKCNIGRLVLDWADSLVSRKFLHNPIVNTIRTNIACIFNAGVHVIVAFFWSN